jgi:polysaccharide pyruvyl transferase WcaK-like protein
MRIHHFYPRTGNIGDHFVQRGIVEMIHRIRPDADFRFFNINSRGDDKTEYGLTEFAIERANSEADLIIVGGSNLYEGSFRWPWGVHLEAEALKKLRVPLFLLGIGSGSNFGSPLHVPSERAKREIKLLNDYARISGARDVITLDWLQRLGISKVKLTGDPATFIFNQPLKNNSEGHVLMAMPPRRFWTSMRQFWSVRIHGRAMFKALVRLTRRLLEQGQKVVVVCNDALDLPIAESLFAGGLPVKVDCPETTEDYFRLLSGSRAVISGRLHTAVAAFSMGIPFLLMDIDQRTHGFVKTYGFEGWSIRPTRLGIGARLGELTDKLLSGEDSQSWRLFIEKRDQLCMEAMALLEEGLKGHGPAAGDGSPGF